MTDDAIILAWVNKMGLGGLSDDQLATMESFCSFARASFSRAEVQAKPVERLTKEQREALEVACEAIGRDEQAGPVGLGALCILQDMLVPPVPAAKPLERVVRVLVYEGTPEWIASTLENSAIKGVYGQSSGNRIASYILTPDTYGVVRLMEAIEGECDGLGITESQAHAILEHVFTKVPR